jgi:tRNA threonylcarbamoyl adenosine modification protein YeaZ
MVAIESAIGGGSISLQSSGREVDCWIGVDNVSRAEDLLPNIIKMLQRNSVDRDMIDRIAVSIGPGSYTGIRIGIATALGLKDSLSIPYIGFSALEAMALSSSRSGRFMTAVPMGRDSICYQIFDVDDRPIAAAVSEPTVCKTMDERMIKQSNLTEIIALESILDTVQDAQPNCPVRSLGSNIAKLIGMASVDREGNGSLKPLFVAATV